MNNPTQSVETEKETDGGNKYFSMLKSPAAATDSAVPTTKQTAVQDSYQSVSDAGSEDGVDQAKPHPQHPPAPPFPAPRDLISVLDSSVYPPPPPPYVTHLERKAVSPAQVSTRNSPTPTLDRFFDSV
ncbi:hypothetical protein ONZ45_g17938 [Pleurotus djamor]|nr:hypothetical protein ONZ45_g17938 [Pleurotus djamor]